MIRPGKTGERYGQIIAGLVFLQWTFGILASIAGASTKADIAKIVAPSPWVVSHLAWISANAWWLVVAFTTLAFSAKWFAGRLEKAWVWECLQTLLDSVCTSAFQSRLHEPYHHHRATLFEYKQRLFWLRPFRSTFWPWGAKCGPWSGWLVPVLRSNHTTKKRATVFLAPDAADRAEGIAGRIWSQKKALSLQIPKSFKTSALPWTDATKNKYEKLTYLPAQWLIDRDIDCSTLALSFWGIPIELKGRRWGVLVLDSRSPDGIDAAKLDETLYARMFDKLIQRI